MQKKGNESSVPALRGPDNEWILDAKDKADLFVDTFSRKCVLRDEKVNEYTILDEPPREPQTQYITLQQKDAADIMSNLRVTVVRARTCWQLAS